MEAESHATPGTNGIHASDVNETVEVSGISKSFYANRASSQSVIRSLLGVGWRSLFKFA